MTRPALGFRVLDEDDDLVLEFPELEGFTHISGFRTGKPGTAFAHLRQWLTTQTRVSLVALSPSQNPATTTGSLPVTCVAALCSIPPTANTFLLGRNRRVRLTQSLSIALIQGLSRCDFASFRRYL